MKRHLATVLVVCLAIGALFSTASASNADNAPLRKEVQAFLDGVGAMLDRKDVAGAVKTVMPGATLRYANGTEMTIEEWKSRTEKEFESIAKMKSRFSVQRAVANGDTAIVTYREVHDWVLAGEKKNRYHNVSRWSVTLVRSPQGWKATHFVEFYEETTCNGKLLSS